MTYRNDVDALAARHAALAQDADELAKQRDQAAAILDDARARARLPVLANIQVASPCTEPWTNMPGDDRVCACGKCQQNVYNLSAMTREEAEGLIAARNGRLCVRYYQRFDGTILLADCEIGRKRSRRRRWIAAGAVTLLAGGGGYGTYRALHHEEPPPEPIMGAMPVMPDPPPPPPAPKVTVTDIQAIQGGVSIPIADPPPSHEVKGHLSIRHADPKSTKR